MLHHTRRKEPCRQLLAGSMLCIVGLLAFSCSDKYDLDTEQPSNLNTLYGYLEDKGNFTNFLQLIDDCGETEVLSKTGSMTLFASDDDAFSEFYSSNSWGVHSYDQLSTAQKKLLLYSAMIGNAYPTSMLSTAEGPVKGEVCRRNSNQSLYDSVQVISTYSDELPQTDLWKILRASHDSIVLFKDASSAPPMVHFTPKFLSSNKLESTDVDFLYNDPDGTRQSDDTYVNDAKITESQFCKNGFVHVVDRVITPLDNMAEIIRKNDQMSIFSSILERFAAPIDSSELTTNYNNSKGTTVDSVFVKRYFSDRSMGSTATGTDVALATDKDGNTFDASLKFDPGWNAFVSDIYNDRDGMMEDMAVMMVPTDAAITEWWNNGGGKVIQDEYGTIDNTPNSVLVELINVNMLNSLIESVPSRFDDILDDANEVMGVTLDAIDSVYIGCNGVVYLTNTVFAPASYSSVLFPAVIDTENLGILYNAIQNMDYDAYLNSMVSTYFFVLPTNTGLMSYLDPVSFGGVAYLWQFYLDESKTSASQICAYVFPVDTATWEVTDNTVTSARTVTGGVGSSDYIENRFEEILDNIIGVEAATEDHHYILTKGKNYIKWGGTLDTEGAMTVAGTMQYEQNSPFTVKQVYNMDNGQAYVIDGVISGTRKATSDILAETPEFSEFYELCVACGLFGTTTTDGYYAASQDLGSSTRGNLVTLGLASDGTTETTYSLLNAYHYTIYVPTNDAMQIAYAAGLPSLDDIIAAEEYDEYMTELYADDASFEADSAEHLYTVVQDFVKYHVQTNSIFLDGGFSTGEYESQRTKLEQTTYNDAAQDDDGNYYMISKSPYRIDVLSVDASGMQIQDELGNTINVETSGGLYNIQVREYWLSGLTTASSPYKFTMENSSSAVIHAVDRPLLFSETQFNYIPRTIVDDDSAKRRK